MTAPVAFGVPAEAAFDFLVDPANRPLWQSSLRRVEDVEPAQPCVGQTWTDVTAPGIRPLMETTVLDRPRRWTEVGRWHGVTAELTLTFEPSPTGCNVRALAVVRAPLVGRAVTAFAPYAITGDLKRAARILLGRAPGK
ncbi:MAG TPA: SRPBCC family protein [Marmoricola sp.]|nr:SRPBCC family protein [Marmoricola sp.]